MPGSGRRRPHGYSAPGLNGYFAPHSSPGGSPGVISAITRPSFSDYYGTPHDSSSIPRRPLPGAEAVGRHGISGYGSKSALFTRLATGRTVLHLGAVGGP